MAISNNRLKLLLTAIFAIVAGILYRLGGWIQTKIRDFGVPTIATIVLLFWLYKDINLWLIVALIAHFGLLFASLTTYFKKEGTSAKWYNWLFCGLAYSLSAIPISWAIGHWLGLGIRLVVLSIAITLWSEFIKWDIAEEFGRGFFIVITLPLLLI